MRIVFRYDGALDRYANAFAMLAQKSHIPLARALNHEGAKAKTQVIRALTKQTGLRRATIVRAVKEGKAAQGDAARNYVGMKLTYELRSKGGNVRLKFFGAREARAGVVAKPWGGSRLYAGAFTRGGRWPKRVTLPYGGHAFQRAGASRLPISQVRSGLFIPDEMIQGASAAAFDQVMGAGLEARVSHELFRMLP
ncbi:MAG: hypothetical protein ACK4MV_16435 [Beijerinckiaceae bacterium]